MATERRLVLDWEAVDHLVDLLLPKLRGEFTAMLMITRGGVIPGGILAERMGLTYLLTAAVDFPARISGEQASLMEWPAFIQFPVDELLAGRRTLIVDDVWGAGRTITAVKNRVSAAGGFPETCVLHYNPYRSLFGTVRPDYYAEITDVYVIYPWELGRGTARVMAVES
jgi:uncharacterized protein